MKEKNFLSLVKTSRLNCMHTTGPCYFNVRITPFMTNYTVFNWSFTDGNHYTGYWQNDCV